MELTGEWRANAADDELRRAGIGLDVDDDDWLELAVPGHWRAHPKLASSDGPILYRKRFDLPAPDHGARRWITFDGIFYQADVWLDGAYLGDPEGYFFPHSFDITALCRLGDDHVVAVEVTCNPEQGTTGRRNITGLFQHSEAVDRSWNPGGMWGPVVVHDTGPVKLDRLRVLCRDADETRAHVRLAARLDSDAPRAVVLRTTAGGDVLAETEHPLAAGSNEIEWSIDVDHPRLWWPRALGDQPLTDIDVDVLVDGETSDRRSRRTGLREVAWNDWVCSVNGERLFLKGANILPTRPGLADATPAAVRRDIELAVEAGLDALRVQAHIAGPELYRAADELGILLLQDFPLQWGYARQIRREAVRQAREAVNSLGHHPSIVQWCAHDEPVADAPQVEPTGRVRRVRRLVAQQLPSWNKSILDRWIKRAFEQADPTRPTVAHGGVVPHLPQLDGTDTHLWLGWHRGEVGELAEIAHLVPRLVRFVSEFGAQSVPASAERFVDVSTWPHLDWESLREHHGLEVETMIERVPPADHPTFGSWRTATQRNQAMVLRNHIETLRRLKYRPTGGFCFSWLADPAPMISASVLDDQREPKLAWQAVVDACRPVVVITDPLPTVVSPGQVLALDVHVVNDLRTAVVDAQVSITCTWRGGRRQWAFRGDVDADSVALIGRVELTVPDEPGDLLLGIALTGRDAADAPVQATRRAGARIAVA
ncbi:MAG: sugar-binding domain-containing protein [Ilumatobacteraceae bacterium]